MIDAGGGAGYRQGSRVKGGGRTDGRGRAGGSEAVFRRSGGGAAGGAFRFRVSDSVDVPLGDRHLLRLKLLEGAPSLADISPGRAVRLRPPEAGAEGRVVEVLGFSETGGRPTQERLERKRELDIVIERGAAVEADPPVRIGWIVEGPLSGAG